MPRPEETPRSQLPAYNFDPKTVAKRHTEFMIKWARGDLNGALEAYKLKIRDQYSLDQQSDWRALEKLRKALGAPQDDRERHYTDYFQYVSNKSGLKFDPVEAWSTVEPVLTGSPLENLRLLEASHQLLCVTYAVKEKDTSLAVEARAQAFESVLALLPRTQNYQVFFPGTSGKGLLEGPITKTTIRPGLPPRVRNEIVDDLTSHYSLLKQAINSPSSS